ncbi:hypothetical protein P7K49_008792 [Saguinus oedipus]|uniref:Sugar phosphate phosphatase n=1 Tax=Saguinus oedipus TaxID=9490 RepID=A0ABQ9VYS0_SAGOE|nr:hypothetical protein P7K49_008792 [Saguinus oedipus]
MERDLEDGGVPLKKLSHNFFSSISEPAKSLKLQSFVLEGVEAEKKAISLLSKLRNELQTDKPIIPLVEKFVDTDIWNQYLEYQQSLINESDGKSRWFYSPWLFVECYMYRRIHEAIIQSPPINYFDVFKESKEQNFYESQESIIALCTHLQQLLTAIEDLDENQLKDEFFKLLQALNGFHPAPLCAIRTLKAEIQVGLQPGQGEQLMASEPSWWTTGKYGIFQYDGPL